MRLRWLVIYDIADPKRLRKVERVCLDHGVRLQESVFLCELDPAALAAMQERLADRIDADEDSVRYYPLCQRDWHTHREDGLASSSADCSAWIV